LQKKIDSLQKIIFSTITSYGEIEWRISALLPLVYDSYSIYQFVANTLKAKLECKLISGSRA